MMKKSYWVDLVVRSLDIYVLGNITLGIIQSDRNIVSGKKYNVHCWVPQTKYIKQSVYLHPGTISATAVSRLITPAPAEM